MRSPSIVALCSCLLASPAFAGELRRAEPKDVGLSSPKLEGIKSFVEGLIDKKQAAGAVVLVARHGKVAYLESFGKADIEAGTPLKPDAIFRIYSMSKPITSVAALILYDEGKFQLDDPVSKYLPELKGVRVYKGDGEEPVEPKREITIRDLMRHTSGFTYGMPTGQAVDKLYNEKHVSDPGESLAEMVAKLGKLPLQYEPGTKFNYSVSTDVLGRLVEVLSGKPFDVFLQDRVFAPLDMPDTGFVVPEEKLGRLTTCYQTEAPGTLTVQDAAARSRYRRKPKFLSGGGGLLSTARDYARFCQMLCNGGELDGKRVLKAETVREMTKNQLPPEAIPMAVMGFPQPGLGFGLGVSVKLDTKSTQPDPAAGEYGWSGAASTTFWVAPRSDTFVIILQQLQPFNVSMLIGLKPITYAAIED